ncbi:MAG: endonuclease V [Candidatus Pacearchaeota archaeon]|nr:endonuclease V [Candidatus Pacearchaeota archaeon]
MLEEEAKERGINIEALRQEQKKLSKQVSCRDAFDFSAATRFGAIVTYPIDDKLLASAVLLNENLDTIEKKFAIKKAKFPYIPGFRAFRELPVMLEAYEKMEEQADVFFILGHGIAHPRGLGIASHFGVMVEKPTIGIAKSIDYGNEKENKVYDPKGKIIAEKVLTKKGAKPIYVSVGHMISLETAVKITKKCTKEPHKFPEPLVEARKFAKKIRKEFVEDETTT